MINATTFEAQLRYLKLAYTSRHHAELIADATTQRLSHAAFLRRIVEAEAHDRQHHAWQRRLKAARFPVKKTLDQFQWDWPRQINQAQVLDLFELRFVQERTNAVFCGGVGLGKSHLATALGYAACQAGHSVLFTTAVDAISRYWPRMPPTGSRPS
jgi:DNA replication protein DnaC